MGDFINLDMIIGNAIITGFVAFLIFYILNSIGILDYLKNKIGRL